MQELGVEDSISMTRRLVRDPRPDGGGSEVVLTTNYRGHLRPRLLWRPFEHFIAHGLHRHILDGMRIAMQAPASNAETAELAVRDRA